MFTKITTCELLSQVHDGTLHPAGGCARVVVVAAVVDDDAAVELEDCRVVLVLELVLVLVLVLVVVRVLVLVLVLVMVVRATHTQVWQPCES